MSLRVIICGGRDYALTTSDLHLLDTLHEQHHFTQVLSGGARGADQCGEIWARLNAIPVKAFPAQWDLWGKAAGFIRNSEMANAADACVVFLGGNGTRHMKERALERGLVVWEVGVAGYATFNGEKLKA